jgi:hypothetical protein
MPAPWLAVAFRAVPWALLLRNAPQIVKAADTFASELKLRRSASGAISAQPLEARVAALEDHDRTDAELLRQLAQQVEALTTTTAILARRLKLMGLLLAAAVAAIVYLLVRGA